MGRPAAPEPPLTFRPGEEQMFTLPGGGIDGLTSLAPLPFNGAYKWGQCFNGAHEWGAMF